MTTSEQGFDSFVCASCIAVWPIIVLNHQWSAGHDEDPQKAKLGRPVERMLSMAYAMLDVVKM